MNKKKYLKFFFIFLFFLILTQIIYLKFLQNKKNSEIQDKKEDLKYNTNIITDVEYITKDKSGNEYFIKAEQGEIDLTNPNVIFLTKVYAQIILVDSQNVIIFSDFGKYNSENNDTIFSKNVIINYLENKITSEYLDFSLERNSMIISKNVIYSNLENILKADVIEINVKTKDTKIFMHDEKKKVNLKNKD